MLLMLLEKIQKTYVLRLTVIIVYLIYFFYSKRKTKIEKLFQPSILISAK